MLQLLHMNVLDAAGDALLLTIDGQARDRRGHSRPVARARSHGRVRRLGSRPRATPRIAGRERTAFRPDHTVEPTFGDKRKSPAVPGSVRGRRTNDASSGS